MKLNYIFNNMNYQALITLIVVCVIMTAPKHMEPHINEHYEHI
jgi:hypothetical protein